MDKFMDRIEHSHLRGKFTVSLCLKNRKVIFEIDCEAAVTLVSEK